MITILSTLFIMWLIIYGIKAEIKERKEKKNKAEELRIYNLLPKKERDRIESEKEMRHIEEMARLGVRSSFLDY